jgi:hypothetical protein
VSQISQPVRILLIGAVVFLAAWFTLLRPKGETVVPPPTASTTTTTPAATSTPQTKLGKAVDAAKKAAGAKTEAPATATPATSTATTSAPDVKAEPAAVTAIPAEALAKFPKDVSRALKERKVLVLGVLSEDAKPWRPVADDDRYVRNYLKRVNRYHGQVFVKPVGLDKLSTYGTLVNDLGVTQSPSIVVIDRNLKGTVLTGYVDRVAINQVIADARHDSITPNITNDYLRRSNELCTNFDTSADRWSYPTVAGRPALVASYKRALAIVNRYLHAVKRTKAPAKFKRFKAAYVKALTKEQTRWKAAVKASKTKKVSDDLATDALLDYDAWDAFNREATKVGATSCAFKRSA